MAERRRAPIGARTQYCAAPTSSAKMFGRLDASIPLALFPVRLEARWLPLADPTEIVIRIFPDEITVDRHQPWLTETEYSLATEYWEAAWRGAGVDPALSSARSWLAGHLGPRGKKNEVRGREV